MLQATLPPSVTLTSPERQVAANGQTLLELEDSYWSYVSMTFLKAPVPVKLKTSQLCGIVSKLDNEL